MNLFLSFLARRVTGRLGWLILSHAAMVAGGFLIRHFLCSY